MASDLLQICNTIESSSLSCFIHNEWTPTLCDSNRGDGTGINFQRRAIYSKVKQSSFSQNFSNKYALGNLNRWIISQSLSMSTEKNTFSSWKDLLFVFSPGIAVLVNISISFSLVVQVAIIIPFRHRENHLKYWLHYLHPILRRQKIDYGIYIINQVRTG